MVGQGSGLDLIFDPEVAQYLDSSLIRDVGPWRVGGSVFGQCEGIDP